MSPEILFHSLLQAGLFAIQLLLVVLMALIASIAANPGTFAMSVGIGAAVRLGKELFRG